MQQSDMNTESSSTLASKQCNHTLKQTNIDKTSYFTDGGGIDYERLRIVNEIYNPKSFEFLLKSDIDVSKHVLEIGCGYGHTAIWIAKQISKNGGRVTAVDFSENTLEITRQNAKDNGITNIDFICFDVSNIGNLKTNIPIDFIYGRWVIEFCKSPPDKILQALYLLLAPGGTFVYETGNFIDSGIHGEPENPIINKWTALGLANLSHHGNELNMARRIPNDLEKIGYTNIHSENNYPLLVTPEHKSVFRLALLTVKESVITNKIMGMNISNMDQFITDCINFENDETKRAKFYDLRLIRAIKPAL